MDGAEQSRVVTEEYLRLLNLNSHNSRETTLPSFLLLNSKLIHRILILFQIRGGRKSSSSSGKRRRGIIIIKILPLSVRCSAKTLWRKLSLRKTVRHNSIFIFGGCRRRRTEMHTHIKAHSTFLPSFTSPLSTDWMKDCHKLTGIERTNFSGVFVCVLIYFTTHTRRMETI